jgi:hypothetical protein
LLVGWSVHVAACWFAMAAYGYKREATSSIEPPIHWPADSQILRAAGRHCLLVFLHPKCSCSQATVTELEKLLSTPTRLRHDNLLRVCVVATTPLAAEAIWANTRLIQRSSALPGAELFLDYGGAEASRFAVEVSGTVMLFDATGAQRYAGGVTRARGHEGDNVGRDTLLRLLNGAPVPATAIPALGCRLVLEDHAQELPKFYPNSITRNSEPLTNALAKHLEAPAAANTHDSRSE